MTTRNRRLLGIALLICTICYLQASKLRAVGEIGYAMDLIYHGYFEKVDRKKLYSAAMRGMVKSLDQHSDYIDSEDFSQFQRTMEQKFGGIGVLIDGPPHIERPTIILPLYDSPAFKAGVEPGDVMIAIDGKPVDKMSLNDASSLMKGAEGTHVQLTVEREGHPDPISFDLVRSMIEVESVVGDRRLSNSKWEYFLESNPEIAYIRVIQFGEKTVDEMKQALRKVGEAKGMILDLRDNPGGLLTAATDICDMFLDEGEIVSTRGRDGKFFSNISANRGTLLPKEIPIVVLINEQSASASEVVAACLQDRQRATIVGHRSFGKGSVQNVVELDNGRAALKLTTARYFPPSGKNIHRDKDSTPEMEWGVQPNKGFAVELTDEQRKDVFVRWRVRGSAGRSGTKEEADRIDPQLQKGIEALRDSDLTVSPSR